MQPDEHSHVVPSFDEFCGLAQKGNVVPVYAEFIADGETPVSAFAKLQTDGYTFLFESTERNEISGRFSFLGAEAREILKISAGAGDPLTQLRTVMSRYRF